MSTPIQIVSVPAAAELFHSTRLSAQRTAEFFAAHIRNRHTRQAYLRAVSDFAIWCRGQGSGSLVAIQPIEVAAWVEDLQRRLSPPTVKQYLAALRMLFDWLVVGQVLPTNPASVVRGPRYSVKRGKTTVLSAEEVRSLMDAIETDTAIGQRDRALIGLLVYTFARVGAAIQLRQEDIYHQGRRLWVRLHEKGGKEHEMPCHHRLEQYLDDYLQAVPGKPKGWLFRTTMGRSGKLTERPMAQPDVYRMIQRRAERAGLETRICCHTFRATGITEYLRHGGRLEVAQQMANHESARTTGLYDRRLDLVTLDEVERIVF
ncbi:MAG: tyrosine-type recombinase/integrase [Acidobacteria bacterium]|nr:tyrosine-type recombinase/integrase [Acidobacteriota bacterium]